LLSANPSVTVITPAGPQEQSVDPSATSLPTDRYPSQKRKRQPPSGASATDVYYFCRATDFEERPSDLPAEEPILETKPKSKFLGCKLCPYAFSPLYVMLANMTTHRSWRIWLNKDGTTTNIRAHLKKEHAEIYERLCRSKRLKHASELDTTLKMQEDLKMLHSPSTNGSNALLGGLSCMTRLDALPGNYLNSN